MSTPDFDAAVERAARAAFAANQSRDTDAYYETLDDPTTLKGWQEIARAALQASGWEEAAETVRELASSDVTCSLSDEESREEAEQCPFCLGMHGRHAADCLLVRARAWVAQYTPEGK